MVARGTVHCVLVFLDQETPYGTGNLVLVVSSLTHNLLSCFTFFSFRMLGLPHAAGPLVYIPDLCAYELDSLYKGLMHLANTAPSTERGNRRR